MSNLVGGQSIPPEQPLVKRLNILPPLSSLFLPTSPQLLMQASGLHGTPMLPHGNLARPRLSLPNVAIPSSVAPSISFAGGPLVSSLSAQTDLGSAPFVPAASRFQRQLPNSPSRENSHSSEDSQASHTFEKVRSEGSYNIMQLCGLSRTMYCLSFMSLKCSNRSKANRTIWMCAPPILSAPPA